MTILTKEMLAERLNGREYGDEIIEGESGEAKEAGLVIVFGYSDDNMELRGAIDDEIGCYNGGFAYLTEGGLLLHECSSDDCPYEEAAKGKARCIEAVFDSEGYTWIYKTDIPHATFDIVEDGERYCRGIVFSLADAVQVSK